MSPETSTTIPEFVITRVFDAPRELVWKAYTEPERLARWWGPKGFTPEIAKLDPQPGGTFLYGMRSPNGQMMWGKWVYREIEAPERMVVLVSFTDAEGNITRHPFSADWPLEMLSTMTLTEENGKTTITITAMPYNATETENQTFAEGKASMDQGFSGTMDRLEAYLADAQG